MSNASRQTTYQTAMTTNRDTPERELGNETTNRSQPIGQDRNVVIDKLAEKWSATGSWRMRKEIGTAAVKIRNAVDVIADSEQHEPQAVAESMLELRDEVLNYLSCLARAVDEPECGGQAESMLELRDEVLNYLSCLARAVDEPECGGQADSTSRKP